MVNDKDTLVACRTLAKEEVKRNLKSPSSAEFPFSAIDSDVVIMKDVNHYCVRLCNRIRIKKTLIIERISVFFTFVRVFYFKAGL